MIKILWKNGLNNDWRVFKTTPEEKEDVTLEGRLNELVDKGNWAIIAATTEYIILQKKEKPKGKVIIS